ncbi:MAG: hypothetical protein ACFFDJ_06380 [Candidatus Odinarchaeota archaeon]
MPRYKKASDGQWPGYPHLHINDIETLTIRQNKYVAESLVNNRKGRVVLLLNQDIYQKFLTTVRERKGDISVRNVNDAVLEAVQAWIKKKPRSRRTR